MVVSPDRYDVAVSWSRGFARRDDAEHAGLLVFADSSSKPPLAAPLFFDSVEQTYLIHSAHATGFYDLRLVMYKTFPSATCYIIAK